jgi:5-oxopent-3-ene-1,2,5-tricarboxylate decarboxylase / 2-hydroxyhepta-2,4-diene-1,7-dioate isomerase
MKLSTVYGSLMHHRAEWDLLGERAHAAPYMQPPQAPVLYIKPANTFTLFGQSLHWPAGAARIQARCCLGLYLESFEALAVAESNDSATKNVSTEPSIALLCDFTLEQPSFYRPPLRFNAFDGSLALPQAWVRQPIDSLAAAQIETWVNGQCVHHYLAADWIRSARAQWREVSRFIAWEAGDVLMMGCPSDAPWVRAGDVVEARMNGQVFTRTELVAEAAV